MIFSNVDTWCVTNASLEKMGTEGKEAIRSGLRELERAGYAAFARERDESGMIQDRCWSFYESPLPKEMRTRSTNSRKSPDRCGKPSDEKPYDGFPAEGFSEEGDSPTKKTIEKKTIEKKTNAEEDMKKKEKDTPLSGNACGAAREPSSSCASTERNPSRVPGSPSVALDFEDEEAEATLSALRQPAQPKSERVQRQLDAVEVSHEKVIHQALYALPLPKKLSDDDLDELNPDGLLKLFDAYWKKESNSVAQALELPAIDEQAMLTAELVQLWDFCHAIYGTRNKGYNYEDIAVVHRVTTHELSIVDTIVCTAVIAHKQSTTDFRGTPRQRKLVESFEWLGKFFKTWRCGNQLPPSSFDKIR